MRLTQLLPLLLLAAPSLPGVTTDPPGQVARLSYLNGPASLRPAALDDWTPAEKNRPVTTGDQLWTDDHARVELRTSGAAIWIDERTNVDALSIADDGVQLRLPRGAVQVRLRALRDGEGFEIATPAGAITFKGPGRVRVDVGESGSDTTVVVREGEVLVTASGSELPVQQGEKALFVEGQPPVYDIAGADPEDAFDVWCKGRDTRPLPAAKRHVPQGVIGAEEVESTGTWVQSADYGPVWRPPVTAGWAPYSAGRWRWIDPWGWTWVDDAPWGFAPFHYGRWAFFDGGWGWCPGVRGAIYAPHLAVFVGFAAGSAPAVAWVPLAPREPWVPGYAVSGGWVRRVNAGIDVSTAVIVSNRNVPGAATAVPPDTFTSGRVIASSAVAVPSEKLSTAAVTGTAPAVAPKRESLGTKPAGAPVPHPPDAVQGRSVQARLAPPPAPVPFAARTKLLDAQPGRPLDAAQEETLRKAAPAGTARPVRAAADGAGNLTPKREGLRTPTDAAVAGYTPRRQGAPQGAHAQKGGKGEGRVKAAKRVRGAGGGKKDGGHGEKKKKGT